MVRPSVRASLSLAVLTPTLLAGLGASPALADGFSSSRATGSIASVTWIEHGALPGGVAGNVHTGDLTVDSVSKVSPQVFGQVTDWTCPDGVLPHDGGHGFPGSAPGGEREPDACVLESARFLTSGEVAFVHDTRRRTATLKGTLRVEGHGPGGPTSVATPRVDMVWTGFGRTTKRTTIEEFDDGVSSFNSFYRLIGASAKVTGTIGAMGFTDDPDDEASGELGRYTSRSRQIIR